jgi:NADH-quinone oxidoreductase subunit E
MMMNEQPQETIFSQPGQSLSQNNIQTVLAKYPNAQRDQLIPLLQEVQEQEGYLSKDAVIQIGKHLKLPTSKIYGVATFYNQFRFQAIGKYHILICRGTACHVKGSSSLLNTLQRLLKIEAGQTTRDGLFSLEVVACIGACGLAPVICVNGEFHGNLTVDDIPKILNQYRNKEKKGDA